MAVNLKTYNEFLGNLVRKIVADTPLNDVNQGSVLLTLLEAVATNDFENSANILSVLETLSIDALRNTDLDQRAADYGLSRISAARSTGFIRVSDTSITKRSTTLYAVKLPPIAGATVIYVNDATDWSPSGSLYIGRGTQQFEGPISYSSITDNGSYFTISLSSALQKDHLVSDTIIDAQGTTDRLINAGTVVKIPANNQNPEVRFTVLRNGTLAAGEDSVDNIPVVSEQVGALSRAAINTIVEFDSVPFTNAAVTNTSALMDGRDAETDDELRERIKAYPATLARGTREAILASIVGLSDPTDGKQISSASLTEPATIGEPAVIYIDDGSGFQPSFAGQGVDVLLSSATGSEEFLQLANYPLPRPQVANQADGPIPLTDGMVLKVKIDKIEESVTFESDQFNNIAAATLPEIIVAINEQASTFRARLTDLSSRILLYPVAHDAEFIQVSELVASDAESLYANSVLKFPTNRYSYISLYLNSELLTEKVFAASVQSNLFSSWNITTSGTLSIEVDGTPAQERSFTTLDFDSNPFTSLELSDWISAFNDKFAGLTATQSPSGHLILSSNKTGSGSSIKIVGGTYFAQMFDGVEIESIGQDSDFALNRQTGNLQMKRAITLGDSVTAGIADAKGNSISTPTTTGSYNLSTDSSSRSAEMVVIADTSTAVSRTGVAPVAGNTITITSPSSSVMRVMANTATMLAQAQVGDFIYIANRGDIGGGGSWTALDSSGLFKILSKGEHLTAGVDSYVDVFNVGVVAGGPYIFQSEEDLQVFYADNYPQLWKGTFAPTPASVSLQDIIDSFEENLLNIKGTIFKTSSVKATSTTENGGSIAVPVSIGRMSSVFEGRLDSQSGNQSHIATKITNKDLVSSFRRTTPTPTNVWLGRYSYTDVNDVLDSNTIPVNTTYSEQLQAAGTFSDADIAYDDLVFVAKGANKNQFRTIQEFVGPDEVRTQLDTPTTLLDYSAGDQVDITRSLTISADDSIVFILDADSVNKTINVNFWRTGRVNSEYSPSTTAFSADDADNEPGITFGDLQVWSKVNANTEFRDYATWFRSRNWYRTGGALSAGGTMILRAAEYGPNGDSLRFNIEYPLLPSQDAAVSHTNNPESTLVTYTFASDEERTTGIIGGTTFKVTSLGGYNWRYTFQESYVDLTTTLITDIISLPDFSGVSAANRGRFSILGVNPVGKYIDVYNPNGAVTSVGSPEITAVTCIGAGVKGVYDVTCTAEGVTASTIGDSEYFTLYDDVGMVVFWYDVDNGGAAAPVVGGASRYVEISTVSTGDTATVVATKTAAAVNADSKFSATSLGNVVTAINEFYGPVTTGSPGPNTGFSVSLVTAGVSGTEGGTYFLTEDKDGTVAVWFDLYGDTEPPHGADRSIQVILTPGDSSSTVASTLAAIVNGDAEYSATSLSSVATITDASNGNRTNAVNGSGAYSPGFSYSVTNGVDDGVETIAATSGCRIFPLTANSVQEICDTINTSAIMLAVPVGNSGLLIDKATREETYTYAGNTTALSYGHDPDPLNGLNEYVSMYDGYSFVKAYENSSPQFVLKKSLILPGVVPTIYAMDTTPNSDSANLGEFFKLIPKTVKNVKHHLSHKALSQLPIVADVDIAGNFRRVQVKSKEFGTAGSVEVVGGRANVGEFSIVGDAQVTPYSGTDYAELKVSAYPTTLSTGDMVKISNTKVTKRKSRLLETDTIDVDNPLTTNFEYRYNPKDIRSSAFTSWAITDVSGTYSKVAGTVWRWTHNDAGSKYVITGSANGSVSTAPNDYQASGALNAAALEVIEYTNGTVSTPVTFALTVSAAPTQAQYFTFQNTSGTTFAIWFGVDGNVTPPSAVPPFSTASNQIMVAILSTDTPDQVISKMAIVLNANVAFTAVFTGTQVAGTDLGDVREGDLLNTYGSGAFLTSWNMRNQSQATGDSEVAGYPVVAVNSASRYLDVVNPNGVAMSSTMLGITGNLTVSATPILRWRLKHSSLVEIDNVSVSTLVATATTTTVHGFGAGDSITVADTGVAGLSGTVTVTSTPSVTSFTYATAVADGTYYGGNAIEAARTVTRYRIDKLGFNNLYRLRAVGGDSPHFADCGIAVDDFVVLSGTTFRAANNGRYRVLAVSNSDIVIESASVVEEQHTYEPFNNLALEATWTANSTQVTGIAGTFKHVATGDWVRKIEDDDTYLVQVAGFNASPASATIMNLGAAYRGTGSSSLGVSFDQNSDVEGGVLLRSVDDIRAYEGDSVVVGDSLVIENISNPLWFNTANSGVREITAFGSYEPDRRIFLRVANNGGIVESARSMSVNLDGFYVLEGEDCKYESIRQVDRAVINQFNSNYRTVYATPADRTYKMTQANGTKVESLGKLGFEVSTTTGVDGYAYYTGLMRSAQRTVDGYEPDSFNFPGRRAVGAAIEILAPLPRQIEMSLDVTTKNGVNLTDISNDIKSAIIGYVQGLGVGEDVVLSEVIARAMTITGIEAVTFTTPEPSLERIAIADDQHAYITPDLISLA